MNKGIKVIELGLFPYDIMVANCVSVADIKNTLKKFGQEMDIDAENHLGGNDLGYTIKLPSNAVLIYFPKKPTLGTIAHESLHAVWMILDTMGVEPSKQSEEVYAYVLEYLTNKIITNE